MEFADCLKRELEVNSANAGELAKLIGKSRTVIDQYCSGAKIPTHQVKCRIAYALDIPVKNLSGTDPGVRQESNRMKVAEASRLLDMPEQTIRMGLKNGDFDFGYATKGQGSKYTYHISRAKVYEYIGKETIIES